MNQGPLVSVVMPVFNAEKYLSAAIESVLAQDYRPIQLIVSDDGSTDNSAAIARGFAEVEYRFQQHAGASAALNHGIEAARGSFIAFLDADDLWVEGKLTRQFAAFAKDPELKIVLGGVEQFRQTDLDQPAESLGIFSGYGKIAMLITREAFFKVGLFDTQWRTGDFIDWFARASELHLKTLMLPEVVARRRIHETNMGIRERGNQVDYARIMKQMLDRRRARPGS